MDELKTTQEAGNYVKLNVGGYLFYTTIRTLQNYPHSRLSEMFSGRVNLNTDQEGWVVIDRSGKNFNYILNYLRDSEIELPDDPLELKQILLESNYYGLEGLSSKIELKMNQFESVLDNNVYVNKAKIIIVKDSKIANSLIASTSKPVIKLTMNRYNNVFSYTNNAHDNLLRNVECLEKYALMFPDVILFIKDVSEKFENNQISEWSSHYRNIKLQTIDCMTIHYTAERRMIKVEFNDSKIHEMLLLLISVATQEVPDSELIEISRRNGANNTNRIVTEPHLSPQNTVGRLNTYVNTSSDEQPDSQQTQSSDSAKTKVSNENIKVRNSNCDDSVIKQTLKQAEIMLELNSKQPIRRLSRYSRSFMHPDSRIKLTQYNDKNFSGFSKLN